MKSEELIAETLVLIKDQLILMRRWIQEHEALHLNEKDEVLAEFR